VATLGNHTIDGSFVGIGIDAETGGGGNVRVENTSFVNMAYYPGTAGIFARVNDGSGNVTVINSGNISMADGGSYGIFPSTSFGTNGNISADNSATISQPAYGIFAEGNAGTALVHNTGQISADWAGIYVTANSASPSAIQIYNWGNISVSHQTGN